MAEPSNDGRQLCYSAGMMVLANEQLREIRYRSVEHELTPGCRRNAICYALLLI